jgi:RNA polymerase sigma factor (sigma-70 family)
MCETKASTSPPNPESTSAFYAFTQLPCSEMQAIDQQLISFVDQFNLTELNIEDLSRFIPNDFRHANEELDQHLSIVRDQLANYFGDKHLSIERLNQKLNDQASSPIPLEVNTAFQTFQQLAWQRVLINHRIILKVLVGSENWDNLNDSDKANAIQSGLIKAYQLALTHDSKKGTYPSYLYKYIQKNLTDPLLSSHKIKRNEYDNYLKPYIEAGRLLTFYRQQPGGEMQILLSLLVYFRSIGRVTFDNNQIDSAIHELQHITPWRNNVFNTLRWSDNKPIDYLTIQRRTDRCIYILNLQQQPSMDEAMTVTTRNVYGELEEVQVPVDELIAHDQPPIESMIIKQALSSLIQDALTLLTPPEKQVLQLRYGMIDGIDHTLEEIARLQKVSTERIRQIEARALRKLRHPTRGRELEAMWNNY